MADTSIIAALRGATPVDLTPTPDAKLASVVTRIVVTRLEGAFKEKLRPGGWNRDELDLRAEGGSFSRVTIRVMTNRSDFWNNASEDHLSDGRSPCSRNSLDEAAATPARTWATRSRE